MPPVVVPADAGAYGGRRAMADEIDPKTWRRVYVATVAYGVLTIVALWWFTAVFG